MGHCGVAPGPTFPQPINSLCLRCSTPSLWRVSSALHVVKKKTPFPSSKVPWSVTLVRVNCLVSVQLAPDHIPLGAPLGWIGPQAPLTSSYWSALYSSYSTVRSGTLTWREWGRWIGLELGVALHRPLLLTWINFNPNMDKQLHPL